MSAATNAFFTRRALAAAIGLCLAGQAHAADIVVNSTVEGSVVGACTVQDAVTAVNTQAAKNGCIAGNGSSDTIDLTGFTTATTITFSASAGTVGPDNAAALALSKPVKIVGPLDSNGNPEVTLQRSTVSGTSKFALIASNAYLYVYGLTLSNGASTGSGGAIYASGSTTIISHSTITGSSSHYIGGGVYAKNSLTVSDCTLNSNTAQLGGAIGVSLGAALTVSGSTFENNTGSAISAPANGTVTRSTFTQNIGHDGGAIAVFAGKTLTVTESTFSGNSATANGGAFYVQGGTLNVTGSTINGNSAATRGGAIATTTNSGMVSLTNSTISGNTAGQSGGGIYAYNATLNYCTVYANSYTTAGSKGAGLFFVNSATANSSVLINNGQHQYDVGASSPTMTLGGGYDVIGGGVHLPANTISCNVNLGPLANFGGPTKTLPLLTGSCAIDAGPFTPSVTTDQRGDPRPVQVTTATPRADIGAFEKQSASDPDFIFINGFGSTGSD